MGEEKSKRNRKRKKGEKCNRNRIKKKRVRKRNTGLRGRNAMEGKWKKKE